MSEFCSFGGIMSKKKAKFGWKIAVFMLSIWWFSAGFGWLLPVYLCIVFGVFWTLCHEEIA
jgi:hypothetical protein